MTRIGMLIAMLTLCAGTASAQVKDYAQSVTDLGHGLYMIRGKIWDMTVAVTPDGVLLVDAGYADSHDSIIAELAKLTDKKVRYVINTHFHRYDSGGNAAFAKEGAIIIGQKGLPPRLSNAYLSASGSMSPGLPPESLPVITYEDRMTLHLQGVTVDIAFPASAHTDSDSYVYFREANVISSGDFFTSNRYPHMYENQGGSIDGTIAGLDKLIALTNDSTKIVPGHGPLADTKTLKEFRAMVGDIRGRVAKLKAAGKTVEQAVAAKPTSEYDGRWGFDSFSKLDPDAGEDFVRAIYRTLP